MDDANFAGLERDLKRRLQGVRLVLEIGLDGATVSEVMAAVADLVPRLNTPVQTLERKRPAILAVYLVNVGVEHYDGSLWPHQPMRQMSGNDLGPAFERVLHKLDLETFDDLGDDLGHRYLTRILGHGGIPKFSTRDYLRLVIDTLRRNPGARADDLVTLWRTQKTAFFGIDEPVRRFLLYGGPVALDFLDRTIDLVALPPSEVGASPVGAYGLPNPHRCRVCGLDLRDSRDRRRPRGRAPTSTDRPVRPMVWVRPGGGVARGWHAVPQCLLADRCGSIGSARGRVPPRPAAGSAGACPDLGDRVRQRRRAQDLRV